MELSIWYGVRGRRNAGPAAGKRRELFYRSGNKMMAVEVTTRPTFSAGKPKMLFEGPYVPNPRTFPDYDCLPDGQRFLMLKASEQTEAPAQINAVLNWFEELKQKVPTGGEVMTLTIGFSEIMS
jgi:hypothetical protein